MYKELRLTSYHPGMFFLPSLNKIYNTLEKKVEMQYMFK